MSCADVMGPEKQHDVFNSLLVFPAFANHFYPLLTDTRNFSKSFGGVFVYLKSVLAEYRNNSFCELRPKPLIRPLPRYFSIP